jgi:hypothetical protein
VPAGAAEPAEQCGLAGSPAEGLAGTEAGAELLALAGAVAPAADGAGPGCGAAALPHPARIRQTTAAAGLRWCRMKAETGLPPSWLRSGSEWCVRRVAIVLRAAERGGHPGPGALQPVFANRRELLAALP